MADSYCIGVSIFRLPSQAAEDLIRLQGTIESRDDDLEYEIPELGTGIYPGKDLQIEVFPHLTLSGWSKVCVSGEEWFAFDLAADLIHHVMRKHGVAGAVLIEWAYTCSRLKAREFGGGVACITAKGVKLTTTFEMGRKMVGRNKVLRE